MVRHSQTPRPSPLRFRQLPILTKLQIFSDRVSLINETRSRLAQVSASRTPKTRGRRRRSVPSLLTLSLTSPHQSTSSWSVRETDLSPALSPSQDIPDGHPDAAHPDLNERSCHRPRPGVPAPFPSGAPVSPDHLITRKKIPSRSIPHDDGFLRSRSQGCTSSRETSTPHAPIAKRLRPCRTVWRSMRPVQRQVLAAKSTCAGAPCRVRVSCQR